MNRRAFITLLGGTAVAWPLAARAQQPATLPTIGYLGASPPDVASQWTAGFVQRLRELGWIEGRTIAIEYRWADGSTERFAEIAAEFVRLKVSLIFTYSTPSVVAAKQATSSIPIVFPTAGDPVGNKLVVSLARPGGNVTGLSTQQTDTASKRIELFREVVPGFHRLAILANVGSSNAVVDMEEVRVVADTLGLGVVTSEIRRAEDIVPAFEALKGRADALYVCADPLVTTKRVHINTLALGMRLPTMYAFRAFVDSGGLISYGPNFPDLFRRAAEIVDKILRGTRPADIPVEQPTKFDLVINLITAKALGLTIPPTSARPRRRGNRMNRREFIALLGGTGAAWPLAARAQQPATMIGFLSIRSSVADARLLVSFRQGLSEAGFAEGRNVVVEYRYAEGQYDRLPSLMSDLIARRVAVIVTTGGYQSALAAKAATTTIPIVFTSGGDPVKEGLVPSLNRPGGNLTGVTASQVEAASKRLGLLREISPGAAVIGVLVNPNDPITTKSETNDMRSAARSVGQRIEILQAGSARDIEMVFASLTAMQVGALVVAPDPFFVTEANRLVALAARHAMPTLYWRREFAEAGGLLSYGSNLADALRVAGVYTGRILKGEKPADLPVQQATKFELVINLKTAKALGLTIPPGVLAFTDEVIE